MRQLNGLIARNWHASRIASIAFVGLSRSPVGLFNSRSNAKSNNLSRSSSASRLKTIWYFTSDGSFGALLRLLLSLLAWQSPPQPESSRHPLLTGQLQLSHAERIQTDHDDELPQFAQHFLPTTPSFRHRQATSRFLGENLIRYELVGLWLFSWLDCIAFAMRCQFALFAPNLNEENLEPSQPEGLRQPHRVNENREF